jgi:hypothetical protein
VGDQRIEAAGGIVDAGDGDPEGAEAGYLLHFGAGDDGAGGGVGGAPLGRCQGGGAETISCRWREAPGAASASGEPSRWRSTERKSARPDGSGRLERGARRRLLDRGGRDREIGFVVCVLSCGVGHLCMVGFSFFYYVT